MTSHIDPKKIESEPLDIVEQATEKFTAVEPRVLLDAVLDFDPGNVFASGAEEFLFAIAGSLDEQVNQLQETFDSLEEQVSEALGAVGGLLDPNGASLGGDAASSLRAAASVFDNVRTALGSALDQFEINIDGFVDDNISDITNGINTAISSSPIDVEDFFTVDDIQSILNFDALTSLEAFENTLSAVASSLPSAVSFPDIGELRDSFLGAFGDFVSSNVYEFFEVTLQDIEDGDGETIVAFNDSADAPAAGTDVVSVTVFAPDIDFEFSSLFNSFGIDAEAFGADDLSFSIENFGFSFDLTTDSSGSFSGGDASFSITADNLDIGTATFGGVVFDNTDADLDNDADFSVDIGLLTAEINAFELAEFELGIRGLGGLFVTAGASFSATSINPSIELPDPFPNFGVDLSIREIGASDFVLVEDNDVFELISTELGGTLSFASGDDPIDADDLLEANQTEQDFTVNLSLSSLLSTGAPDLATEFINNLDIGFAVDVDGDPDSENAIETVISSLVGIGAEEISAALQSLASRVDEVLASELFDFEIPFTDLEFGDAFSTIGGVIDDITDAFSIDLGELGFGTAFELFNGGGGVLSSAEIVLSAFEGVGSFTLTDFNTGATLATVSVGGSLDSLDDLVSAINSALDAEGLDLAVGALNGGIAFTLLDGAADDIQVGFGSALNTVGEELSVAVRDLLGFSDFTQLEFNLDDLADRVSRFGSALDLSVFDGVGSFTLFDFSAVTDVNTEDGVEIKVNSPDASGGFASLEDLQNAVQTALDGVSGPDVVVDIVDGALSFSLPRGAFDSTILTFGEVFDTDSIEIAGFDLRSLLGFEAFTDLTLSFQNLTAAIPNFNLDALNGAGRLVFSVFEGTTEHTVEVATVDDAGMQLDAGVIIGNLNDSLADFGVEAAMTSSTVDTGTGTQMVAGIAFELAEGATNAVRFGIDFADSFLGLNIDTLIDFGNEQLGELIPGAGLALDDQGRLQFILPALGGELDFENTSLSLQDLGFDLIGGLELTTEIMGSIAAELSSVLAIDIAGFTGDALGLLQARAQGEEGDREESLLDNLFLQDTSVSGQISASATDIAGEASLGFVTAEFGQTDASQNFVNIDAQLEATLIGEDDDGVFSSSVSFSEIIDAFSDNEIGNLIGRVELAGGLVTNDDGSLIDGDLVFEEDIFDAELDDGQINSLVVVQFGDVSIDVEGIGGLGEDAINGVFIALPDLFDLSSFIVNIDSPFAETLIGLNSGDLLDSLTSIGNLLGELGNSLADDLPFLATDIPILNFNVLDVIDFGTEFLEGLVEFRADPAAALSGVEEALEGVFGDETVDITFSDSILGFNLALDIVDGEITSPFSIDLIGLLGDELEDILGETVADLLTGLVDARGDGSLIIDPDISLNLAFGIDLSGILEEPDTFATAETALALLATTSVVTGATQAGRNDLRITRTDVATGIASQVEVELAGQETLGDAITTLNSALESEFGSQAVGGEDTALVSVVFDDATGTLTLVDLATMAADRDQGVDALFGETAGEAEDGDDGFQIAGTADVSGIDFGAGYAFDILIGEERETITIAEDTGRTDLDSLVGAVNTALAATSISRGAISETAIAGTSVNLGQLFTVSVSDSGNELVLAGTNFAEANGFEPIEFAVDGVDASIETTFEIESLDGSNIARLLGLETSGAVDSGSLTSDVLFEAVADEQIRLFVDTENTNFNLGLTAGAQDINVVLGAGPIEINVIGGTALIDAGDGTGDAARLNLGVNDIDGEEDGQLDLSVLGEIANDENRSFLDLFNVDAAIGLNIDLPFSDSLGLFDPAEHGLTLQTELLTTDGPSSLEDLDLNNIGDFFGGALAGLIDGTFNFGDDLEFNFPDLSNFLADINVLDLLNDPLVVLEGLELIFETLDEQVFEFLDDLTLPIIGDNLASGVTIFQDIIFDVLEPAIAAASTPDDEGNLPTSVDLLTGFLNEQLSEALGIEGDLITAFLNTDGSLEESFFAGALSFSGELFNEELDIGFDFGIPGLELEVEEGTAINLSAIFDANIAFGIDRNGFFLLNDTDEAEIAIDFEVDAGNFQGAIEIAGLLRASASAVDEAIYDNNGFIVLPDFGAGETGNVNLNVEVGLDLFGDAGTAVTRDFSPLNLTTGQGAGESVVELENIVRLNEISFSNLAEITLEADGNLDVQLVGEILNPLTGEPITAIPSVVTDLLIEVAFDLDDGLTIGQLEFQDLRLDLSTFFDDFIQPILDPLEPFLVAFASIQDILDTFPLDLALEIAGTIFPVINLVTDINSIISAFGVLADTLEDTGGILNLGDFDFGASSADLASGTINSSDLSIDDFDVNESMALGGDGGSFAGMGGSITIDVPLFTDPSNALNLILGNVADVELITASFALINIQPFNISLVDEILMAISAPEAVINIVDDFLVARIFGNAFAGFEVGFDLAGVANFINTLDPVRLLDGIFIDSSPGSLVDINLGAELELDIDLGVVGASLEAAVEIFFQLAFNDPNNDNQLRLPELAAVFSQAFDADGFFEFLEIVFEGEAAFEASASIAAFFLGADFDIEIFNISEDIMFGGDPIEPTLAGNPDDTGGTAILNVGARIAESLSSFTEDADDEITISGSNSPNVTLTIDGETVEQEINGANSIIIPAGEGDNTVDLSEVTTVPTLTFTGSGNDVIDLPDTGFHVVFSGGGNDIIRTSPNATGTYWIFSEDGSDEIATAGGQSFIFAADDFGLRDAFIAEFLAETGDAGSDVSTAGSFTKGAAEALLASQLSTQSGQDLEQSLAGFIESFTVSTQTTANEDADTVTVGSGSATILAGAGDDIISVNEGAGTDGEVTILGGNGDDQILANGTEVFIEGGAGSDLIQVNRGDAEIYGFGQQLGIDGQTDDDAINALALRDGDDVIISGSGNDQIFGQRGDNIISGGLGDDLIHGGRGDDIVSGGVLQVTTLDGVDVVLTSLINGLTEAVTLEAVILEDGNDMLFADGGDNIVIGGGDADTITGGQGSSILVGDFASVEVSTNLIAQGLTAAGTGNLASANDMITGGIGNDVIIGGGGDNDEFEVLQDTGGSNIIIGDSADIEGARILETVDSVVSVADTTGNSDRIRGGEFFDILFGGEGDDEIIALVGSNIVAGDNASFERVAGTGIIEGRSHGAFESIASDLAGDDTINIPEAGDPPPGNFQPIQLVIGGGGDDKIELGDGGHTVVADDGAILFDPVLLGTLETFVPFTGTDSDELEASQETIESFENLVVQFESQSGEQDGSDTVIVGDGNNRIILGDGIDSAMAGAGDNIVIGDVGSVNLVTGTLTAGASEAGGVDTIISGDGAGIFAGGSEGDEFTLGEGSNFLLGDSGSVTFNPETGAPLVLTSEHNALDGDDTVTANDGDNFAILGGGGDSFTVGDGANIVIADGGTIDTVMGSATNESNNLGGEDRIESGTGNGIFIGGSFDDELILGDGDNRILGDTGTVLFDPDTFDPISEISNQDDLDGDDTVTVGNGVNRAILGGGSDTGNFGNGGNIILGDSGQIQEENDEGNRAASTLDAGTGESDTINSGTGDDVVIAGDGDDSVTITDGDNVVAGDGAEAQLSNEIDTPQLLSITSVGAAIGGVDTVNTGAGNDIVIGGAEADLITTNDGDDIIGGDLITISTPANSPTGVGEITSDNFEVFADDIIDAGSGNDLIIGGRGDDTITLGDGFDIALADNANVQFVNVTDINGIQLSDVENGGDDILNGDGNDGNLLVGQAGDDQITGGSGDDILIGDLSLFTFLPTGVFDQGENLIDRVSGLEFIGPQVASDDVINAGSGRDILLGGFGDDLLNGDEGQDILIGDSFIIQRSFQVDADGNLLNEELFFESNFAFETGGFDTLDGGSGADIAIGHLGPDFFFGNTEDDFLLGDSAAFNVIGSFAGGDFNTDRFLQVLGFNFPGLGAQDILSVSQINSSIGAPLEERERRPEGNIFNFDGELLNEENLSDIVQTRTTDLFISIVNVVNSDQILALIASFANVDVDPELLIAIIKDAVLSVMVSSDTSGVDQLLLERMIEKIIKTTIQELIAPSEPDASIGISA